MVQLSRTNPLALQRQKQNEDINSDSDSESSSLENELAIDTEGFSTKSSKSARLRRKRELILGDVVEDSSDDENDHSRDRSKQNVNLNGNSVTKNDGNNDDDDNMFSDLDNDEDGGKEGGSKNGDVSRNGEDNQDDDDDDDDDEVRFLDVDKFEEQLRQDEGENEDKYDNDNNTNIDYGNNSRFDEEKRYIAAGEDQDNYEESYDEEINTRKEDGEDGNAKPAEIKFTSFGLKEELKEGRFDENENFIRYENNKEDERDKQQDSWLKGIRPSDIEKAKRAEELAKETAKAKAKARAELATKPVEVLLTELIVVLQVGENSTELLQRLNGEVNKIIRKNRNKYKKKKQDDLSAEEKKKAEDIKNKIEKVTGVLQEVVEKGGYDEIYEMTREELMRKYKDESGEEYQDSQKRGVKRGWDSGNVSANSNNENSKIWEFKWNGKDQVYGPYSTKEIAQWKQTYFQDRVVVKHVDAGQFVPIAKWDVTTR